jgi:hypothetical protein
MRYHFYVHNRLSAWRMVTGEHFRMPAGHSIDDWTLTRTREEEDTGADMRRDVAAVLARLVADWSVASE